MRLTILFLLAAALAPAVPRVLYSSAKAGPNQGWAGSATQGAAINLWGSGFGTTRGSSFVTVAGVPLTSDSGYAEWGATSNPTTAKGFQRITFWLNSSMPVGNMAGITVTVGGMTSNTLPFTIVDNTGGVIRFIDGANGDDSWDGQYPDHTLGGSHGPWKTTFLYSNRPGNIPGTFFYMRGGTYTAIFDPASDHTAEAYIGAMDDGAYVNGSPSSNCATLGNLADCGCGDLYSDIINGTDALRYTVTSYPGENAIWQDVGLDVDSSYWTFTNFSVIGSGATSTTSQTVGTGNKTFTVSLNNLNWMNVDDPTGLPIDIFETSNPNNYMIAYPTAINGTTVTLQVYDTGGSGTHSDWTFGGDWWGWALGMESGMCSYCQHRSKGLSVIGISFTGFLHHAFQTYGDNFVIAANYINFHPTGDTTDGYWADHAYGMYIGSGDNLLVSDNETHGGGMYGIHNYDEYRCSQSNNHYDINRRFLNQTFDSNWIDITRDSFYPQDMRAGILTGQGTGADNNQGDYVSNSTFRNNVIFSRDNLVSQGGFHLASGNNSQTINGVHFYNNTLAGPFPWVAYVWYDTSATWNNVDFINNIFNNISQYEFYVDSDCGSGSPVNIHPTFDHNIIAGATRYCADTGTTTNSLVGSASFVNASSQNFRLASGSLGITAGASIGSVTRDYDDNARPASGGYTVGAFEYESGRSGGIPPAITTTSPLPGGTENWAYTTTFTATGDTPMTWSATDVPDGLSMSADGVLNGTPTAVGTFTVNVIATNAAGKAGPMGFSLTINPFRHRPARPSHGQINETLREFSPDRIARGLGLAAAILR